MTNEQITELEARIDNLESIAATHEDRLTSVLFLILEMVVQLDLEGEKFDMLKLMYKEKPDG